MQSFFAQPRSQGNVWRLHANRETAMTTYKTAAQLLTEAVKDPTDKKKLAALKKHPRLKKTLVGINQEDLVTMGKVAKGGGIIKCVPDD
jgi:hypothetical protein